MGCPVDAKQSMLVTYLPDAVALGATVVSRLRVDRFVIAGGRVTEAQGSFLGDNGRAPGGPRAVIKAKYFITAGGAINSPALLLRSGLGDAARKGGAALGRRTFLHPVVGVAGIYKEPVEAFYGAPQSVASHHHADRGDKVGVFLETAPLHPMLAALSTQGFGGAHAGAMKDLPNMTAHIGLAIDGFHPSEQGGTVTLRASGAPVLDYALPERIWEAHRFTSMTLARANLAAGALRVATGHDPPIMIDQVSQLDRIERAPYAAGRVAVFSAHVMGGCAMGDDSARAVVRSADLRHHDVENLHVIDGSVFPTSIGANPQLSIYGLAHLISSELARTWKA
jgi:choline dehydrogenase-like flavoprotein